MNKQIKITSQDKTKTKNENKWTGLVRVTVELLLSERTGCNAKNKLTRSRSNRFVHRGRGCQKKQTQCVMKGGAFTGGGADVTKTSF